MFPHYPLKICGIRCDVSGDMTSFKASQIVLEILELKMTLEIN